MWVPHVQIARSLGHPFHHKQNEPLKEDGFDSRVEELCEPCFRKGGGPSIPPGVYFRMLIVGYLEGVTSEREIAWRCADRLSRRYKRRWKVKKLFALTYSRGAPQSEAGTGGDRGDGGPSAGYWAGTMACPYNG